MDPRRVRPGQGGTSLNRKYGENIVALRMPTAFGFFPLVLVMFLATMNVGVLFIGEPVDFEMDLWEGPLMPGKLFPLPLPTLAKIISPVAVRTVPVVQNKLETLEPVAVAVKEVKKQVQEEPEKLAAVPDRFIVQLGQFKSRSDTGPLMSNLSNQGYDAKVQVLMDNGYMNEVQAGPFWSLERAREFEVRLRAVGMDVWVQPSDEGYFISLIKAETLEDALAEMNRVEAMGINPVRLVKVENRRPVHTVFMGPYNSKAKANEVMGRMGNVDLAVPEVTPWSPQGE